MMSPDDRTKIAGLLLLVANTHVQISALLAMLAERLPGDEELHQQLKRITDSVSAEHASIGALIDGS